MKNPIGTTNQQKMKKMKKAKPVRWAKSAKLFAVALADYGTKAELASLMDVSPSFLDSILRGIKPVPPWHALKVAEVSKVAFSDFVDAHLEDVETTYIYDCRSK